MARVSDIYRRSRSSGIHSAPPPPPPADPGDGGTDEGQPFTPAQLKRLTEVLNRGRRRASYARDEGIHFCVQFLKRGFRSKKELYAAADVACITSGQIYSALEAIKPLKQGRKTGAGTVKDRAWTEWLALRSEFYLILGAPVPEEVEQWEDANRPN